SVASVERTPLSVQRTRRAPLDGEDDTAPEVRDAVLPQRRRGPEEAPHAVPQAGGLPLRRGAHRHRGLLAGVLPDVPPPPADSRRGRRAPAASPPARAPAGQRPTAAPALPHRRAARRR